MKDFVIRFLVACIALNVFRVSAQSGNGASEPSATTNQVVRQNLRLPEIRLHDPWILAHAPSKTYYLYASDSRRATGVDRARDEWFIAARILLNWDGPVGGLRAAGRRVGGRVNPRGRPRCMSPQGPLLSFTDTA